MQPSKHITQIVGLPRSRSAWLSVALTRGNAIAFHDLSGLMQTAFYHQALNDTACKNVIDCSSALIMRRDLIAATDARLILIERDAEEARHSYAMHVGARVCEQIWPLIMGEWEQLKLDFGSRTVGRFSFGSLSRVDTIRQIWELAAPGEHFDGPRVERLQRLNIQEVKR